MIFLNPLKIKEKLNFTILNNTANYTLYPKILISIQVNDKLDIGVQNKTSVIILSAKHVFKKFMVQSEI